MPGRINETLDAWDRIRGNDGPSYIQSDEAKATIMEGFGQLSRGEAPTKIIDYTQNLLSRRMDPRQVDQIVSQMLGHFQEAERTRKTNTLQGELRGSPATDEPVQLGGPGFDPSQGAAGMTQPARAPRDMTQADVIPLLGSKAFDSAGGFGPFLAAPSAIRENDATAGAQRGLEDLRKVEAGMGREQQMALDTLPESGTPTPRQLGRATQGRGLATFMNNEADNAALAPLRAAQGRLEDLKGATERLRPGLIGAQTGAANAAAGASNARARLSDRGLGQGKVERDKDGNPIVTEVETDAKVDVSDRLLAASGIAAEARRRGAKTREQVAQVADDMGFDLTGDFDVTGDEGSLGGWIPGGKPTLTGNFSLKPQGQTKKTIKAPANKMPGKDAQPTKAGEVGGNSGRIRFDAKGERVR
jgi:hypothetical protein